MLYGIRPAEQLRLAAAGAKVRVYVPYGSDWYGYLVRRLAERPANLAFFLRSLAVAPVSGPPRAVGWPRVIAILGAGKMGEALSPACCGPGAARPGCSRWSAAPTARPTCARATASRRVSAAEAAKTADTLVITVKPQDMAALLDEIAPHVPAGPAGHLGGGRHHHRLRSSSRLGGDVPVVRVMSNTPVWWTRR